MLCLNLEQVSRIDTKRTLTSRCWRLCTNRNSERNSERHVPYQFCQESSPHLVYNHTRMKNHLHRDLYLFVLILRLWSRRWRWGSGASFLLSCPSRSNFQNCVTRAYRYLVGRLYCGGGFCMRIIYIIAASVTGWESEKIEKKERRKKEENDKVVHIHINYLYIEQLREIYSFELERISCKSKSNVGADDTGRKVSNDERRRLG